MLVALQISADAPAKSPWPIYRCMLGADCPSEGWLTLKFFVVVNSAALKALHSVRLRLRARARGNSNARTGRMLTAGSSVWTPFGLADGCSGTPYGCLHVLQMPSGLNQTWIEMCHKRSTLSIAQTLPGDSRESGR